MPGEIIEAESMEEVRSSLAVRKDNAPAQWTPSFAVGVDEAVARVNQKHEFFQRVMREGDHYGVIPGTGTKPTLLKPGAELLLANMGLNAEFSDAEPPTIDIDGRDHNGEAFIRYRRVCRIYRQLGPTEAERMLVGKAEGSCSSWEAKYRYRDSKRKCPVCAQAAIIKGKAEYGGGWLCFKKQGGCGAKFDDGDTAIVGQTIGRIPNPDVADSENTILKMADKRALVAATLIATGCSDIFTQDLEPADDGDPGPVAPPSARTASAPPDTAKAAPTQPQGQEPLFQEGEKPPRAIITPAHRARLNGLEDRIIKSTGKPYEETVALIVKQAQKHFGDEETGKTSDLFEGEQYEWVEMMLRKSADKYDPA